MPRKLRVEYAGAMYHVMSRGDRYESIYLDDVDREDFLKTLAEACQKAGWQVNAYCLMRNHYHVVLTCAASSTSGRAKSNFYQSALSSNLCEPGVPGWHTFRPRTRRMAGIEEAIHPRDQLWA